MVTEINKKVKISKLIHLDDAVHDAPSMNEYVVGRSNGNVSLPVDYWIEGYLTDLPTVGRSVLVNRTNRNGVEVSGIFKTSTVTEITDDGFKTLNSVYKLEYV